MALDQMFGGGNGAVPGGVMLNYVFVPNTIHVKAGQTLTIYNDDTIVHTVVVGDGSVASGFMGTGAAFTMKFDQPGTVAIRCTLHNRMRGTIVVDPPDATTSNYHNYAHGGLPPRN